MAVRFRVRGSLMGRPHLDELEKCELCFDVDEVENVPKDGCTACRSSLERTGAKAWWREVSHFG